MEYWTLVAAGMLLIFLGVALVFLGVLLGAMQGSPGKGGAEAGGVVLIGPIPLIFGTSARAAMIAVVIAIVLLVAALVLLGRLTRP